MRDFLILNPTGLPYTVVIDELETNTDLDILPGDEIGIFDGSTCVGLLLPRKIFPLVGYVGK